MPDVSKRLKRYSKVNISNVNIGGIADSDYNGAKNSVADMLGFDIHSEPGVMKVNQALTLDSASTITEAISAMVQPGDGNTYLFGSSTGKIWSRDNTGTYTLVATNANGATYGAEVYKGFIYYFSVSQVGRVAVGAAWSTRNDSYAAAGGTIDRPTCILNDVLYFGCGTTVGQIDTGTVTVSALALPTGFTVTALGQMGTDLLIGTQISVSPFQAQIFRWNTWSVSFTNSEPIPEQKVYAFLPMLNFVLVQAGMVGNIYIYNGASLDVYKNVRLNSAALGTAAAHMRYNACLNFGGKALFGFSLLYSLARANRNYPFVLNKEIGISTGNLTTALITSMVQISVIGGNIFLVAWQDGSNFGVDRYDTTAKYTGAYIKSRMITVDRFDKNTYGDFKVAWRTKPVNTIITMGANINNGGMTMLTPATDQVIDVDRNLDQAIADIGDATQFQAQVNITPSGNTAPEIEQIEIGLTNID